MSKPSKIISVIILGIGLLLTAAYFGIRNFTRSIYNERSCELSNIDNVEMHSETDVPVVLDNRCKYAPKEDTKRTRFVIDKKQVNPDEYIRKNKLKKLASIDQEMIDDLLTGPGDSEEIRQSSELYIKEGTYKNETWVVILDKKTGKLWITIRYNEKNQ